jgi:dienelactone hydrolase
MAERDLSRPGGWSFRTEAPVSRPLDYVVQVGVAAGDSPVELNLVFTDDGLYVPAIVRKPPGRGPFPAVICMHGGTGGLGISYLVDQVLNRGFVFDRLLEEGYVVVFTEGRMEIEWAYGTDIPASLDHNDLIATFRYMQRQSYVDPGRVAFFGISHGGELQMKLISEIQEGPAALVPAEPAVVEYLALQHDGPRTEKGLQYNDPLPDSKFDMEVAWARIQRVSPTVPILVLGRDTDHLQGLFHKLYELLDRAGRNASGPPGTTLNTLTNGVRARQRR